MFTVLDRVVISPLPYAHPERLVFVAGEAPGSEMTGEFGPAAEFYLQYKETARLLEDVAVYGTFTNSLRVGDRVERVRMAVVTNSLYSTLGATPALGRLPVAADEDRVAVISDALWRSWFGGRSLRGRAQLRDGGREPDHRRRDAAGVPVPERRHAVVGRGRHPRRRPAAGTVRLQHGGADGARHRPGGGGRGAHRRWPAGCRSASAARPATRG